MPHPRRVLSPLIMVLSLAGVLSVAPAVSPLVTVAAQDAPIRVGGNVKGPKKVQHVDPVYPPEAREAGIEGIVILEIVISTEGRVTDAKVLRSIPALDAAALAAVRQWRFEPTLLNGQPVAIIMSVTVNFSLE